MVEQLILILKRILNFLKQRKNQMAKYYFSNEAVEDLSEIWNYTFSTWSEKQADTYYELIDQRIANHGENIEALRQRKILLDGQPGDLLLQIFSTNQLGPIFFEFIQRKGNEGFGEGNFKALFDSIELDQIRRGVLTATKNH